MIKSDPNLNNVIGVIRMIIYPRSDREDEGGPAFPSSNIPLFPLYICVRGRLYRK